MEIILASTSTYRRELMDRLRLTYRVETPPFDEEQAKQADIDPRALAMKLALGKARSVQEAFPEALVIGADQLAALGGMVLGKPDTPENAFRQLKELAGHRHQLITAVAVLKGAETKLIVDATHLTMCPLSADAIRRYVVADEPLDCAGSYKIERLGISLFEKIESEDFTAIQGLPLIALTKALRELGVEVP